MSQNTESRGGEQVGLEQMIAAITKTFVIAHESDPDERLAAALVFNAGRLAWRMRESGLETDYKTSISDVVTDADRAAESFIAGALEALRPSDGLLGEEGAHRDSASGRFWVIDPVDGTYNFTSGSDYWCSALALVDGDPSDPREVILGAVHRPAMGYTWLGGPKRATTRDDVAVNRLSGATLAEASTATYLHPASLDDDAIVATWIDLTKRCATQRMLGAGSVDLAGVADGTSGLWFQHSVADWDWLPGRALVEGAGGKAVKVTAGGVTWCVAGAAALVDEATAVLSEHADQ